MRSTPFKISVIVPVYNEQENIKPFLRKIIPIVNKFDYEIIFVDDGSNDKTSTLINKIASTNKQIKLISFIRNFGHQMALSAGYQYAKGDCVVSIDVDLQDPPQLVKHMISYWQKGYDVVYARRQKRREGFFKKYSAGLFYQLINFLSDTPIPIDVGDFRLLDRKVVIVINNLPEKSRFLRGLVAWTGFKSTSIQFDRGSRRYGKTHYPLSKMMALALDGIISFSNRPLRLASFFGILTAFLGIVGIIYALIRRFLLPQEFWVTGWTAIFVSIMFFGGIQLITIGIIGEYIAKIYTEIQGRPPFFIKEKVNL